jgi:rhomboid family GlyGly-CTERM serine protease
LLAGSYQIAIKHGRWLLAVLVALSTLSFMGDSARDFMRYERIAIAAGEWWRLLTCHLVHLDWQHAAMNMTGLILLWWLFAGEYTRSGWMAIATLSALSISLALWHFDPAVASYVGLSGVLHALLVAGSIARASRRHWDGALLLVFVVVKLSYEQRHGATLSSSLLRSVVIVDAHLYGAVAGAVFGSLLLAAGRYTHRAR